MESLQQLVLEAITLKKKDRKAPEGVSTPIMGTYNFYDFLMQSNILPVDIKIAYDDVDRMKKFAFIPSLWTITDYNNGHVMLSKKNDPSYIISIIYGFQNWGEKFRSNPSSFSHPDSSPFIGGKILKNNLYIDRTDPSRDVETLLPEDFKNSIIDIFELITKKHPKFAEELSSDCRVALSQKKFRTIKKTAEVFEEGVFAITGALKRYLVVLSDKKEVEIDSNTMDVLYKGETDNCFVAVVSNAPFIYENLNEKHVTITANMDDKKKDTISIKKDDIQKQETLPPEEIEIGAKTIAEILQAYKPSIFKDFQVGNQEQIAMAQKTLGSDYVISNFSNENRVSLTANSPKEQKILVLIITNNPVSFFIPSGSDIIIGKNMEFSRVIMANIPKGTKINYQGIGKPDMLHVP